MNAAQGTGIKIVIQILKSSELTAGELVVVFEQVCHAKFQPALRREISEAIQSWIRTNAWIKPLEKKKKAKKPGRRKQLEIPFE